MQLAHANKIYNIRTMNAPENLPVKLGFKRVQSLPNEIGLFK